MPSSHDFIKDNRNKNIKIFVNDKFYTRDKAKVSVFDSGFLLGDGVWSGIRYHNNKFLFLKDHLIRLFDDAKKIDLKIHLSKKQITKILTDTIKINKMKTDVHLRLVVSRGIKSTPYQDPAFTISKPTIVVIPEYKQPQNSVYKKGLILKTVKTIFKHSIGLNLCKIILCWFQRALIGGKSKCIHGGKINIISINQFTSVSSE